MVSKAVMVSFFFFFWMMSFKPSKAKMVPALFVFGDSLVDVWNNNYLSFSIAKADFPNNGIDFPTRKPTGRFSNGKNIADFVAEKLGLPTSPPYLSLLLTKNKRSFLSGVSFASGASGILNATGQILVSETKQELNVIKKTFQIFSGFDNLLFHWFTTSTRCTIIPLTEQVNYYASVYEYLLETLGSSGARKHLSKSLFGIVTGNNDIFSYSDLPYLRKKSTPQQYVDVLILTLKSQIKRLYVHGARKFVFAGLGPIGCVPSQRIKSKAEECNEEVNGLCVKYNEALKSMLLQLKSEIKDINYSYVDTYSIVQNIIQKPDAYGFSEVKAACCGLGKLKAEIPCIPISTFCPNRSNHLFWDIVHTTEATDRTLVNTVFDGSSQYVFPIDIKQLIAI